MAIDNYFEAKKKAKKEIDTRSFYLRESYLEAEKGLMDNNDKIDYSLLNTPEKRNGFINKIYSALWDKIKNFIKEEHWNNGEVRESWLFGYLGLTKNNIFSLVEGYKSDLSFDKFFEEILNPEKTLVKRKLAEITQFPITKLSKSDAEDVVRYTGLEGKVDPKKLRIYDLAELLDIFERFGVVPPKAIEDKPYLIK